MFYYAVYVKAKGLSLNNYNVLKMIQKIFQSIDAQEDT